MKLKKIYMSALGHHTHEITLSFLFRIVIRKAYKKKSENKSISKGKSIISK